MTILQLRELAAEKAQAARDIMDKADSEGRGMTEQEATDFESALAESKRLETEADRRERLEKQEQSLEKPQDRQSVPEISTGERIEVSNAPKLYSCGELRAYKGPKAKIDAYRMGQFLLAAVKDHPASARAQQYCRDHGIELRVQTESVNSAGGFLVPEEMENAIIILREQYGMFRANARVVQMTSDHMIIPRRATGVTAYFVGETDSITASEASWNQVELTAKKLGALTRISSEINEDAVINVADYITNEMAYAFAVKEDQCGLDGDGTSTYGGMVGIRTKFVDGDHTAGYDEGTSPCTAWSHLTIADEITTIMGLLPAYALPRAKWFISQKGKASGLDALALAGGGNTTITLANGAVDQKAFGYPVVVSAAMPSDPTDQTVFVLFGDLSLSTTFGDRRGITLKVSDQRYLEYDQIGIQATERFCIVNHDIGDTSTAGPIVAGVGNT